MEKLETYERMRRIGSIPTIRHVTIRPEAEDWTVDGP